MLAYGHNFFTEDIDDGCVTQDYGVEVKFNQYSHATHRDQNLIGGMLGYVKKI